MEIRENKKEMTIIWFYAVLILAYAVFDIYTEFLPKLLTIPIKPNTAYINFFFIYTGITLYTTPINIIIGIGLLTSKFWARYGVIATMFTLPVILLTQYLGLGIYSFHLTGVLLQLFFVVLTLYYFSRKAVKSLFGDAHSFKMISWHGLLFFIIILVSFSWIFLSLHWKIRAAQEYGQPFFVNKPRVVILNKPAFPEIQEKFQKVELLNASLFIPKEFRIRRLYKLNPEWNVVFQNKGKEIRGVITLTNKLPYGDPGRIPEVYIELRNKFGNITKFNFEKYFLTNNWNPAALTVRSVNQKGKIGSLVDIEEIHSDGNKGFWERRQQADDFFCGGFTLYAKEGGQFMGGYYLSVKKYFDENLILPTLSSIEFLKSEGPDQAKNHYEQGLISSKRGETLQAQVEFANAYMLSPENPDYIFMFAKSVLSKEMDNEDYVRDLLKDVLKIKPGHKEARKLLKGIGPKIPPKTK